MVSITWNRIRYWKDVPTLLNQVIDNQRSDVDLSHGYFYLGNYYDALGNDGEAVKNYSLSISRNDDYLLAYNNRGIIRARQMNMNAAIADFTKAIAVNPDYAESYYNRGIAHFQQQNIEQACADWTRASQLGFKQAGKVLSQYCR
jgi:tetratricopeptide (TPR) repeat protein